MPIGAARWWSRAHEATTRRALPRRLDRDRRSLDVVPRVALGAALIGSKIGDNVSYSSPGGTLTVHVVSIDV